MYSDSPDYRELKQLSARICAVCKDTVEDMKTALLNGDTDAAERAIKRNIQLNAYSRDSDAVCGKMIALYWPRGGDMRYILSAIKTSADFERIGDLCQHLCRRMLKFPNPSLFFGTEALRSLVAKVAESVEEAVDAYYLMDKNKAEKIIQSDVEIDLLKNSTVKDILLAMKVSVNELDPGVHMINAARRLERMADHAKHIAEAVLFIVSGNAGYKGKNNEDDTAD